MVSAGCSATCLEIQPVRNRLAHHVGQGFAGQRGDRHPAHALGRPRARSHRGGIDHEFQRKMREHVGDDARLAVPARRAPEHRRLLQRRLVILSAAPELAALAPALVVP